MPSRNTLFARNRGYSDIKQMNRDEPKSPKLKNFGVRCGVTMDTADARANSEKKSYNPPNGNNAHWKDSAFERKQRHDFMRPPLSQRD